MSNTPEQCLLLLPRLLLLSSEDFTLKNGSKRALFVIDTRCQQWEGYHTRTLALSSLNCLSPLAPLTRTDSPLSLKLPPPSQGFYGVSVCCTQQSLVIIIWLPWFEFRSNKFRKQYKTPCLGILVAKWLWKIQRRIILILLSHTHANFSAILDTNKPQICIQMQKIWRLKNFRTCRFWPCMHACMQKNNWDNLGQQFVSWNTTSYL